jgi:hypothetical protein
MKTRAKMIMKGGSRWKRRGEIRMAVFIMIRHGMKNDRKKKITLRWIRMNKGENSNLMRFRLE